MGTIIRGVKNTFRNKVRSSSIALILGLSIGLGLVMLIALNTINAKIDSVKSSIGNTITVSPAGSRGFEGGGEPLTEDQMSQISKISHVTAINTILADQLTSSDTSLQSAIQAGTLGRRFGGQRSQNSSTGQTPSGFGGQASGTTPTFTPPVTVTGTNDAQTAAGSSAKITSGQLFASSSTDNVAVIGTALATKNSLSVGSTFTAYGNDIKVVAIFDAGNQFANSGLIMPLATVQKLSDQAGDVTSAIVTVDSVTNMAATTTAIKNKLSSAADVTSSEDSATNAIAPLENIKTISSYSLFGALAAGAVIIFLSMLMIVRERRREIGVLKAIGAPNASVIIQFMAESITLTLVGAVFGTALSVVLSNPILRALTNSSSSSTSTTAVSRGGAGGFGGGNFVGGFGRQAGEQASQAIHTLQAAIGLDILLYGLVAALGIAVIGSIIPAWLTARIKPAEVLRGE